MERKRRIPIQGKRVDVTEVGFRPSGEHWNEYLADDGSVIRVKLVVTEILRVDDQYDDEGNPGYYVKHTTVTSVSASDEMRKEP